MTDRYDNLLNEFSIDDRTLLLDYLSDLFEYQSKKDWEQKTREKFEESLARIKEFEKRANAKLKELKINPACSFCKTKADSVEKIFQHKDHLNICSDCVTKAYEQL